MTRPGYKMTEIGEIPEEWELVEMGDNKVSEIVMGQSPPSSFYNTSGEGIPFLQGNAEFGEVYPSPSIYCSKPLKVAEKGDILLSIRAPVGELNIASFKCVIGRGLAGIRCKDKKTHSKYLYYYLKYSVNRLKSMSTGSTFKAVGKDILSHFEIWLPDFEEQQKIAEVLSTADETIQKVNEEITLTEKLKKGLMQTLLTKGIGHSKFKISEIGEIPEEWDFTKIEHPKVSEKMKAGGTPLKSVKDYYKNGTIPFVKIEDIVDSSKYLTRTFEFISANGLRNSSSWLTPKESILFSMYASYGEVCINKISVATNQAIISIVPNKENVDVNFLYYELKNLRNSLKQYLRSTTQSNLNAEIVRGLKIILPPLPEQQKIAEILTAVDNKLELLGNKKAKLEKVKRGLMGDLLTGKMRVKLNTSKG